jgi:hypothetical protein
MTQIFKFFFLIFLIIFPRRVNAEHTDGSDWRGGAIRGAFDGEVEQTLRLRHGADEPDW